MSEGFINFTFIICPECGTHLCKERDFVEGKDKQLYCRYCGEKLTEPKREKVVFT